MSITPESSEYLWILAVAFVISFILAFGLGANDVANSFGTSVGSKVLTLRQACVLATIFEIAGSVLMGFKVSETVRTGIVNVQFYNGKEVLLMYGCICALAGSAVWLITATFLKLPISGTHSIVGATLGFHVAAWGFRGVKWIMIAKIVVSWFISPVLSGAISVILFVLIRKFILRKTNYFEAGLKSLPFFYSFTLFVNVFSIVHEGSSMLYFNLIPLWGVIAISCGVGIVSGLFVACVVVPWQRRKIIVSSTTLTPNDSRHISLEDIKTANSKSDVTNVYRETQPLDDSVANNNKKNATKYHFHQMPDTILDSIQMEKALASEKSLSATPRPENEALESKKSGELILATNENSPSRNNTDLSIGLRNNMSQLPLVTLGNKPPLSIQSKLESGVSDLENMQNTDISLNDQPETAKLFSFLQVLTACFGSFAHGGNDVSNAIGPLIAIYMIWTEGSVMQTGGTPIWILLFGGIGISFGLWVLGKRVIETLGEELTAITPSSGFTIEIGAAFTVLLASKIGIPISTTHCKVGSVVFVGYARSRESVQWRLFRNIALAWIVTLPIAGGISAGLMAAIMATTGNI